MAPKKKQQQKGSGKDHSKPKGHSPVTKSAPKLQISAENERLLRRLLLNSEAPQSDTASTALPVVAFDAGGTRSKKAKRLRGVYDKLSLEGFTSDQIEQALSTLNETATFETALDWLCLNIPGTELPLKFSSGATSSANERDWSVRIISTAQANWVPAKRFIDEVEGTSGVSVWFKGQDDEVSLEFGKSSQAEWIRQYLEHQEAEEEDEHNEKEKEVDPSSYSVSIAKEYRQARLGALEAKKKGDRATQKHYSEIINKLKQEFTSLGLSENDLESDLKSKISNLKTQEMPCDCSLGQSLELRPPDDDKFECKDGVSAFIVDSSNLEEPNHAIGSLVHTVPEECKQKEELEEMELDNLFSDQDSFSSGALPSEALKLQKKEKLLQSAYGHILGNIDEIWKKGSSRSIPKAVLQKFCQRLRWEAPKYNKVSTIEDKFLYSVSVLQTASGRGKSRKAGGLITFHLPNQDEAFRSVEEAQNKVAAFALYQLFPDLPFNQLLIEPYASYITKRLEEDEFSAKVEDKEDNRRAGFVDSLLAAGASQPLVSKDAEDESVRQEMLVDLISKDNKPNMSNNRAKLTSLNGLSYHEQLDGNLLKEDLQNKMKNPKYMTMLESRAALPIAKLKDTLLQLLHDNDVIVVSGETGSGKTTQVPQFILDDMIESGLGDCCNIICTQPRRIAAMSVAKRVSDERCETSPGGAGSLVGYQVRLDSARNERTKLLFCTTGILLRKLAGEDLVGTYVIVDEVHERSLLGDFLLIILKNIIKRQTGCKGRRSKLKVILMSATVDSSLFSKYFGHCPIISAEGRTHPVSIFYLEDIYEKLEYHLPSDSWASGAFLTSNRGKKVGKRSVDNHRGKKNLVMSSWGDESLLYEGYVNPYYFAELYQTYSKRTQQNLKILNEDVIDFDLLEDLICHIDATCPPGAILVFLPGVAEIEHLVDKLAANFQFGGVSSDWVLPLHSSLASIDQHKVFSPSPENIRKVIISTDIAETSITIDDVMYVVDTGKHKESRFNPQKKMSSMVEEWISQANAKQRRGRAGRVRPGICFCMYTHQRFEKLMRPFQVPEMLRLPLSDLCLQIKYLSLGDIKSFLSEAIEPPGEEAISSAIDLLNKVGAFEGYEELSPLGYHLAKLPVDVRIGKMMLYGAIFGCLSPILSIAAFLSHKSPFMNPKDEKHNVMRAKSTLLTYDLSGGTTADESNKQSDHLLLVVAYNKWARILHENGSNAANRFCHSFFLNSSVMYTIRDIRIQFGSLLADIGLITLPQNFKGDGRSKDKLESWFADMKQPFNVHAMHSAVITSVLCAGLYPNVAATVEGTVGVPLDRNKAPSNNISSNDYSLLFDGKREVHLHPSSVNYNIKGFRYPFLVFHEKAETSKVFLRDTSIISPYSLLLFGGSISVQHQMGLVIIDNWLKLTAPAQTAVLFKQLRLTLHAVLKDLIRKPEVTSVSTNEVVKSIIHLLLEEGISQFS